MGAGLTVSYGAGTAFRQYDISLFPPQILYQPNAVLHHWRRRLTILLLSYIKLNLSVSMVLKRDYDNSLLQSHAHVITIHEDLKILESKVFEGIRHGSNM